MLRFSGNLRVVNRKGILMDIKATTGKLLKGDVKGVVQDVKYQIERSVGLIGVIIIS